MSELEKYKEAVKDIALRNNDCYYDTKVIATAVYLILEQMVDRNTEPNCSEKPNNCEDEPTDCETCLYAGECDWEPWQECPYEPKDDRKESE